MKNGITIVAATDQPEQRLRGGKMDLKFAAVARNYRHRTSLFAGFQ